MIFRTFLSLSMLFISTVLINGQEAATTDRPAVEKPGDFRTNALRQLGLTREQFQRIRALNQERKPLMDAAQTRLRQANRDLDAIIYADNATDAEVQTKLKDFQSAQAEVARIRFMNELGVRRILTTDQLVKFRLLRQRFEQARVNSETKDPARPQFVPQTQRPRTPIRQLVRQDAKKP